MSNAVSNAVSNALVTHRVTGGCNAAPTRPDPTRNKYLRSPSILTLGSDPMDGGTR